MKTSIYYGILIMIFNTSICKSETILEFSNLTKKDVEYLEQATITLGYYPIIPLPFVNMSWKPAGSIVFGYWIYSRDSRYISHKLTDLDYLKKDGKISISIPETIGSHRLITFSIKDSSHKFLLAPAIKRLNKKNSQNTIILFGGKPLNMKSGKFRFTESLPKHAIYVNNDGEIIVNPVYEQDYQERANLMWELSRKGKGIPITDKVKEYSFFSMTDHKIISAFIYIDKSIGFSVIKMIAKSHSNLDQDIYYLIDNGKMHTFCVGYRQALSGVRYHIYNFYENKLYYSSTSYNWSRFYKKWYNKNHNKYKPSEDAIRHIKEDFNILFKVVKNVHY
jgi:hypothetical protein